MLEVKKAIIPAGGLGTRFFPLSRVLAKEFLPLADRPLIDYAVEEAKQSDISRIVFVLSKNKKTILDYFKKNPRVESLLKKNGRQKECLDNFKQREEELAGLSFSSCLQPSPKGDGDAIAKARNFIKREGFAVLFPDEIFLAKEPAISQLKKIFQTGQNPVIGLKKISKEKISSYGVVSVERIANRLYKIKGIVEKPSLEEAPSDLAVAGRYILTPDIFSYLKKTKPNKKGEVILADAFDLMLKDGKVIYGYEMTGQWLECGKKIDWLESNLYFCLEHPKFGPVIRDFLKKNF